MSSDGESDQEDTTIANPAVVEKYKLSARIVNAALQKVVDQLVEGKSVVELCDMSDKFILEQTSQYFKKNKNVEKGIAFPTCLSINNVVGHFSPEAGDKTVLKNGDIVKIDLGAHLDGYIAVAAHTHVVGTSQVSATTGKGADAICAAHIAAEAVLRLLKPGNKNTDIAPVVQTICETFKVNTVEAVLSHHMDHHVIDGTKVIPNKLVPDQAVEEFTFEENDVYAIDIVVSTGTGKTREEESRPTVYKRDVDKTYLLKLQAARKILSEISKKSPTLPFAIRNLEEKHARFGLSELEKHNLIHPYPILFEKSGEIVAQFKYTAFVGPQGALRITGLPLPFVSSQFSVEDARVKELLSQPVVFRNKKAAAPAQTPKAQEKSEAAPMETN